MLYSEQQNDDIDTNKEEWKEKIKANRFIKNCWQISQKVEWKVSTEKEFASVGK